MDDDIPPDEKQRRLKGLEALQEGILASINAAYMGDTVSVLSENRKRGSWTGRTRGNKLVYFDIPDDAAADNLAGRLVNVRITRTGLG